MSKFVDWAKSELDRIGNDTMQQAINKDILQIVEVFDKQGHSGFSAGYALGAIKRLLAWKPLKPLTGDDDEWGNPFDDDDTQQNKRYSAVFRKHFDNSTAYNIEGKAFSDDGGETWYTSRGSRVSVVFPYAVPDKPEYVILGGDDTND